MLSTPCRSLLRIFFLLATLISTCGCHPGARDFEQRRGFPTKRIPRIGGNLGESRQIDSEEEFGWIDSIEDSSSQRALDAKLVNRSNSVDPGEKGVPGYADFRATREEEASIFQKIFFETNDDLVRGATNFEKAHRIAHFLKKHPRSLLFLEGHCDERGAASYNLALGSRRANSVRALLLEQGVAPKRIFTITFGHERPAVLGNRESSWKWNRRVEYKLFDPS